MLKKPKNETMITGDAKLAKRYGVSTNTIAAWRLAGLPCTGGGRGRLFVYQVRETDPWVELHRKPQEAASLTPQTRVKLSREAEKLKQDRLTTTKMEHAAAVAAGNVLPRDEWELFAIEVVQQARDKFMRLPKMLCKHVPAKYHRVLQVEGEADVRKICAEMARHLDDGPRD
jgi:hypothetical protein